jgi:SpoVK/Ycf46/Vps4 family AAA+-type ATPase
MEQRFKFKSLNVYSNNEWMANSGKRYRTVFDAAEVDYIRCELAIYNKLFDENDWSGKVNLKAVDTVDNKEICNLDAKVDVKKEENIFYLRDGWGNATLGTFWKKGTYKWQAFIDDVMVGEQIFYINDIGLVSNNSNPYLKLDFIKLYSSNIDGWKEENRKYLHTFSREKTKYVWAEIQFKNLTNLDYHYELYLNFYDDSGQPKASIVQKGYAEAGRLDQSFMFERGWGNDAGNTWRDDKYTLEIVFNDVLIGAVSFNCGYDDVEGETPLLLALEQTFVAGSSMSSAATITPVVEEKTLEELLAELDALIGLESVKKSVRENITYLKFTKLRKEKGYKDSDKLALHSIFTGNPGTGKTTIVKMLGKIYQRMGLLSKGHVVEVDRSVLVGEFIGQTAPKTKKALDSARGGILFIDEAYSLARVDDDSKDFGKEVIEVLLKEMSDGPGDIAIIGAGYPKEMQTFIESNPGLKSRFAHYFHFDDYMPEELYDIAIFASKNNEVTFSADADAYLKEQLIEAYRKRDENFGNARFVHGVIGEAKMNMGLRLMKVENMENLTNEELSTLQLEDLQSIFLADHKKKLNLTVNDKQLQAALAELYELSGLEKIKQDINELVKLIRFYNEVGKDVVSRFSLHSVFTGNPGTGKTTLARIIAKIYKALGLLERGHVVEVDREGLIAGYSGQTAIKTAEKIEDAMGGILFIDEAYGLAESGGGFGQEAIQVILKRMEDARGKFGVIVAGYPENMQKFIESNPGFKSRFDKTFHFEDYNTEQLFEITLNLLKKEQLTPSDEANNHLKEYLNTLYEKRDKFFGNARSVRQVVGDVVMKQNLRLASMPSSMRTAKHLTELSIEDVKHLMIDDSGKRQSLGFRFGGA